MSEKQERFLTPELKKYLFYIGFLVLVGLGLRFGFVSSEDAERLRAIPLPPDAAFAVPVSE